MHVGVLGWKCNPLAGCKMVKYVSFFRRSISESLNELRARPIRKTDQFLLQHFAGVYCECSVWQR
jgi:hypothetical protein